ncbi:MAG: KilA-N domain-containing protein, partial [Anaerovoracaceae bacterium]
FQQLNPDKIPGVRLSSIGGKMRLPESSFNVFVSLTDIAREKDPKSPGYLVLCWMRSSNTVQYLRLWEKLNNPEFLDDECDKLLKVIRTTPITLTPKMWVSATKAIGITSKAGKYGGTLAHPEIADAFRAWLFPEVMLEMVRQCRMQASESEAAT